MNIPRPTYIPCVIERDGKLYVVAKITADERAQLIAHLGDKLGTAVKPDDDNLSFSDPAQPLLAYAAALANLDGIPHVVGRITEFGHALMEGHLTATGQIVDGAPGIDRRSATQVLAMYLAASGHAETLPAEASRGMSVRAILDSDGKPSGLLVGQAAWSQAPPEPRRRRRPLPVR